MELRNVFFFIIIVAFGIFLSFYGIFNKIDVEIREIGDQVVLYKRVSGDYKSTVMAMDEVFYELKRDHGIVSKRGYGKYFDNPNDKSKPLRDLRSEAGVFIEPEDIKEIFDLNTKFETKVIKADDYIVAEFPFRTKMSSYFGVKKVYPALEKFCLENGYSQNTPVIEISNLEEGKIIYLKEIN